MFVSTGNMLTTCEGAPH